MAKASRKKPAAAKKPSRKPAARKKSPAAKKKPAARPAAAKKQPNRKKPAGRTVAAGKTAGKKAVARQTPKKKPAAAKKPTPRKKPVQRVKTAAAGKAPATKQSRKKLPAAPKAGAGGAAPLQPSHGAGRLHALRKTLISRREAIVREAKEEISKYISGETRQLVDTAIDEGDWALVDISEDISLRRLSAHRKLMLDIDEALRKIREGSYGTCEECGEEIAEKRLSVLPTATLCVDCKEHREKFEALEEKEEI